MPERGGLLCGLFAAMRECIFSSHPLSHLSLAEEPGSACSEMTAQRSKQQTHKAMQAHARKQQSFTLRPSGRPTGWPAARLWLSSLVPVCEASVFAFHKPAADVVSLTCNCSTGQAASSRAPISRFNLGSRGDNCRNNTPAEPSWHVSCAVRPRPSRPPSAC